jgi:hypothetical protein
MRERAYPFDRLQIENLVFLRMLQIFFYNVAQHITSPVVRGEVKCCPVESGFAHFFQQGIAFVNYLLGLLQLSLCRCCVDFHLLRYCQCFSQHQHSSLVGFLVRVLRCILRSLDFVFRFRVPEVHI